MYQTQYMITDGRRIPYIEKDGLRMVAIPRGFDLTERVQRESELRETSVPLPHPGYDLRLPTHLGLADCLRLVREHLDPTQIALKFQRNGIQVLATNFLPDVMNLVLFKGNESYRDDTLLQEYRRILKSLQPEALILNLELTDILNSSIDISYQITPMYDDFVPKAGTFPSFWYETDFKHENGVSSDKVVQATILSPDQKILEAISRVSALRLGEEEISWIKRLFSLEVIQG